MFWSVAISAAVMAGVGLDEGLLLREIWEAGEVSVF